MVPLVQSDGALWRFFQVYQKFLAVSTGLSDSALQSIAGQKRSANVEQSTGQSGFSQPWQIFSKLAF